MTNNEQESKRAAVRHSSTSAFYGVALLYGGKTQRKRVLARLAQAIKTKGIRAGGPGCGPGMSVNCRSKQGGNHEQAKFYHRASSIG